MSAGSDKSQKIELPFSGGLAQQFHPRHAPMGAALVAKNGRFTRDGGFDKRPGNLKIGVLTNAGNGRLMSRGSELVAVDPTGLVYSYAPDPTAAGSKMVQKGGDTANVVATLTRTPVYASTGIIQSADLAYGNGLVAHVWVDEIGTRYSVRDATTDAEMSLGLLSTAAACVRCCYVSGGTPSGQFVACWDDGTNIYAVAFSATTHAVTAGPTTIITDARNGGDFEICSLADGFAVAYQTTVTTTIKVRKFSSALVLAATSTNTDANAVNKTGWSIDATGGEFVWVGFTFSAGGTNYAKGICLNPSTLGGVGPGIPFTVASSATESYHHTTVKRLSSTTCLFGINGTAPTGGTTIGAYFAAAAVVTTAGAISGSASAANRKTYHCTFASEPFVAPDGSMVALLQKWPGVIDYSSSTRAQWTTYFSSYVLCDLVAGDTSSSNLQAVPLALPVCARTAFHDVKTPQKPSSAVGLVAGSGQYVAAVRELRGAHDRMGMMRVLADFGDVGRFAFAEVGLTSHYTPGGTYDGQFPTELGFIDWPQEITAVAQGAGTGAIAAGDYAYVVHYTDIDRQGNVLRSQVSAPVTVTAGALDSVVLTIPALTLTQRQFHNGSAEQRRYVRAEIFRTTVGGTTAGPFYWHSSLTLVRNDTRAAAITATDAHADATVLTGNPAVYTTGNVLGNVCPPSLRHLVSYRSRLVGIGDDGRTAWFSKAFVEGETPGFCDAFTLPPLDDSETVSALAVMDDRLVAFTRSRIYWTAFDGPPDTGGASDVGPWRRISSDVGCIDARSVVPMPAGLIFQSAVGLQLLNRGLGVQQPTFGLPVQTELETYPVVTSGTVHPSDGVVYVTCATATDLSDRAGERLVYDYTAGKWSVDTLAGWTASQMHVKSTLSVAGRVYWLGSDLAIYQEQLPSSSVAYLDDGAFVARVYETAWVHPTGLQGWITLSRVLFMAERFTSHGLSLALYRDFSDTATQTFTLTYAALDALADEQWSQAAGTHKTQAFKVRVTETAPSTLGTGRGAEWISLALDVEGLDRTAKFAAAQRG